MVDKTQLYHLMNNTIQTKAALTDETKAAFLKYKTLLLSQLSVGDVLEGKVVQSENGSLQLQLKQGITLPMQLEGNVVTGKLLTFIVAGLKGGMVQLKPQDMETLGDKIIKTLDLPNNEGMKTCVDAFMKQELSLDKQMLLKGYRLQQEARLPYPVITRLIEQLGDGAKQFLSELKHYRPQTVPQHIEMFRQVLMGGGDSPTSDQIHNQRVWVQHMLNTVPAEKLEYVWEQVKELLDASKMMPTNVQEPIDDVLSTVKLPSFNQAQPSIECQTSSLTTIGQSIQAQLGDQDVLGIVVRKLYDALFDFSPKSVNEQLSREGQVRQLPLYESYTHFEECLESMKEMRLPPTVEENLTAFKEQLAVGQKLQVEGNYFVYPFDTGQKREDAIVYFYKKKHKDEKHKQQFLTVIALDMPALDKIELHINQMDKDLEISIFVGDDDKKEHIEKHFGILAERLEGLGYRLSRWGCYLKERQQSETVIPEASDKQGVDFRV